MRKSLFIIAAAALAGCRESFKSDASGAFEAVETVISAQTPGVLREFSINEGDVLAAGQTVGYVDTVQLYLQKQQLVASRNAVKKGLPDVQTQIRATQDQIASLEREKARLEKLVAGGAATTQQLDEMRSKLDMAKSQLAAQRNSLSTGVGSADSQAQALDAQIAIVDDQLVRSRIVNPGAGVVTAKYAERYEVTAPGRPLYKIADMENIYLRAYVSADQLTKVKLGGKAAVYSDFGENEQREYEGTVVWIADRAEFTPKTIQMRDERANMVYAVKIAVRTDGYLKIGMYGETVFE